MLEETEMPVTKGHSQRRGHLTGCESYRVDLQTTLSKLLAEVRAIRRGVERTALANAQQFSTDYKGQLSRIIDQCMASEDGRTRVLYLACAAELGILSSHHLDLGADIVRGLNDPALRALYWTASRRCGRKFTVRSPGVEQRGDTMSLAASGQRCRPCAELAQDNRRYDPHAKLRSFAAPLLGDGGRPPVAEFQCESCNTRWVRRVGTGEYFAAWTAIGTEGMGQ